MMNCKAVALVCLSLVIGRGQTPFDTSIKPALVPYEIPSNRGAAALWQSLRKLGTRASLIMITAHPDDEDGAMLTYEARAVGARVALLTLNRGEGGANVMSSDYWDALGLVRTQELLTAGRYYGVDQYFTRVCDYGFSKTMEESLSKWKMDSVLEDVVRVVRQTRPLVVTSVFLGAASDGHGNHQVAGRMAKEVFEAAGDPLQFPEQIKAGLHPWKPLKYYAHTPWMQRDASPITKNVEVPVGTYNALLGETFLQLSKEGLGFEKSQNGGTGMPPAGAMNSPYHRFASRVPALDQEQTFFDGIDTSLLAIGPSTGPIAQGLKKIDAAVKRAASHFSAVSLESCAPDLAEGLNQTQALLAAVESSDLSADSKFDITYELKIKVAQFNNALIESLGLALRATVMPDRAADPLTTLFAGDPDTFRMVVPGKRFRVKVSAVQQTSERAALSRVSLASPQPDWWAVHVTKQDGNEHEFEVTASESIPPTRPYFSRSSIEQPSYDIRDPNLAGLPEAPCPLHAWAEFSYKGVAVKVGQVVQTSRREVGPGVVYQPVVVGPAISVKVEPKSGIVPISAKSFDVTVSLHSNVHGPTEGKVQLKLPRGWKSDPAEKTFVSIEENADLALPFRVTAPTLRQQLYEIQAVATCKGRTYSEGYQIVGYPGLRPSFLYQPARLSMSGVDVSVAPGLKVAYVTGTGDAVPAALKEIGISPTFLSSSDLAGDLGRFNVIVLGVRAYAARPDLIQNNQRLMQYVKDGGTVIVQYNTPEFDHSYGPYPYSMGQDPEEVTDEESRVTLLQPENPVLVWPNRLTEADFRGWVEERGSKFLTTWDSRYQALLETHDAGQAPQKGGLLYARYGKGFYVYNAYALYRELPEGVPGAFRLMANLLSLPMNPRVNASSH